MHHHPSGRDAQVLSTHPLHVVWVILPNILFILFALPLKMIAKAYKLWQWYCINISDFLHPLSEVPVFETRTLIAGERGTPTPCRGPIWRLDTAFRSAGLQQRWLSRTMMFRQSQFVNPELSILQATSRHVVSHVNRLRDLHTRRVSWVWRSVKHYVVADGIAFHYYTGHRGHF